MIKNFFRIVVRNIARNKISTFLNVTGLAIGLASSLLILLWINDEMSYEKFNVDAENIYRVEEDQFYSGEKYHVTVTPQPAGPVWKEKIPEIKHQTRLNAYLPRILFSYEDKQFFEPSIAAADSEFVKIFTVDMVSGDAETALNSPHSILLSEKLAKKYFGKENPIGKAVTLENKFQFMVSGVMKDLPGNSMFTFEGVIPYSFLKEIGAVDTHWGNNSIFTFVSLENNSDIQSINKKLTDIVVENAPQITTKYSLFPLLDIHLHGQFGYKETKGPVIIVSIFSFIAIFILLIACINFVNLSTAKASARSKEIGIKKISGADQFSMIIQFMLESLMMVALAMIISLILVGLSLEVFNNVSGKNFGLRNLFTSKFIISFILVGLVAGIISGIYPSLYLSSFKPAAVLKGDSPSGKRNGRLRHFLVVIQFTLSILIAVSAIFMYKQLKYIQNKDLGFNKENLINIPMSNEMKTRYYSFKGELEKDNLIQGVTAGMHHPARMGSNSGGADWDGKDPEKNVLIGTNVVDYDYLKTLDMHLLSGRDFSREFPSDMAKDTTGNFLVNEEVVTIMGIGDPIGKNFRFMGIKGTIVGVLKNFHYGSADRKIQPMAFALSGPSELSNMLVRLTPGSIPSSLKAVEETWKRIYPEYPLDYTFVDQDYNNLFKSQIRLTSLLKYFTILALIIACLGLYGLSSYSAVHRTNEVGIRKVMGAGSFSIMVSMAGEFIRPVLISIVLAMPLGWIIVTKLLNQFDYRIEPNILVFFLTGLCAVLIALLTVSFHAYRATIINPSEALKID